MEGSAAKMANIYDILLVLSTDGLIQNVICQPLGGLLPMYEAAETYIHRALSELPNTEWDWEKNSLIWDGVPFIFEKCEPVDGLSLLLLRREPIREQLLESALDIIADGIQVYDADAKVCFFNNCTRQLLELTPSDHVEGRGLTEIFVVTPEYSTTLSALKTRSTVHNRFDCYKSATGKKLSTVNNAIPIVKDGRLLGCLTIERDMKILQKNISDYREMQEILLRHSSMPAKPTKNPRYTLNDIIGNDPLLIEAKKLAEKMATKDVNLLIQGETGTGKEIFAQGIHNLSSRKNCKFVAVNCAAFPETLIESLLFGTTKGAFTDSTDKAGLIEEANHGTLFLDELNSMSLGMQAKLLRVLQEKTLRRIGGTKNIPVDVRVISSCNEDAYELSESGGLRRDLFYRLAPVIIEIPPLRERVGDIQLLTWHYIHHNQDIPSVLITDITQGFWELLEQHRWPGNVRELFHVLYFAINDCEDTVLRECNLPPRIRERAVPNAETSGYARPEHKDDGYATVGSLSDIMSRYERQVLAQAYAACERNVTKTADRLKISRQSFQYYMKKYRLNE